MNFGMKYKRLGQIDGGRSEAVYAYLFCSFLDKGKSRNILKNNKINYFVLKVLISLPNTFASLLIVIILATACDQPKQERMSRAEKRRTLIDSLSHFSALPEQVKAPKDNPLSTEKIELGRLLFFDPILSGNKDVACASCHHPAMGYAEILDISIGVNGRGFGYKRVFNEPNDIPFTKRNSPTIINTAFNGINIRNRYKPEQAPMFWDLRASSLEEQALEPIKSMEEMRGRGYQKEEIIPEIVRRIKGIPVYQRLFDEAFDAEASISAENIAKAIASFERSLLTNNSRFDQYMRGDKKAISISEREGFEEFVRAGCGNCHNGPMFSDFQQHVLGVPDNQKLSTLDMGIDSSYAFRTPTLRNLRFTFPYMHNGSMPSLQRVLEFYEDISFGVMRNPNLSKDQLDPLLKNIRLKVKDMAPIISFLNTLNDNSFDQAVPESVPSGLPVGGNIN